MTTENRIPLVAQMAATIYPGLAGFIGSRTNESVNEAFKILAIVEKRAANDQAVANAASDAAARQAGEVGGMVSENFES